MGIRVAFLDCDGTLTKVKSSWEYLHRRLNIWDGLAVQYQELFRAGKIDYVEFCERDAFLWKGLTIEKVMDIISEIKYREGAKTLVEFLKSLNVYTVIVSTGISLVVEKVKKELGIDLALSNELLSENGVLTGAVKINVEFNKKDRVVKKILNTFNFEKKHACAIGDGEGDEGLFNAVNLAIILTDNIKNNEKDYIYCSTLYDAKNILERYIKSEKI
ncbi:MAG TPA: HAD-IB family phosphatase [Syntrophorhabdaceae bacterium]|nr:HAD-IB family phosphatase [Syntrophorhabdaceae bacterium]HPU29896.1 HAD-IB family phosphatase [Syntrophorhabdaceae bacterium]